MRAVVQRVSGASVSVGGRRVSETGAGVVVLLGVASGADTRKGNRPSFSEAAGSVEAAPVYEHFCAALADEGVGVSRGVLGARMEVALVNDGPVTIVLDG